MKRIVSYLVAAVVIAPLSGCFVSERPGHTTVVRERERECPPAHHWEDGECVHNGNARGHDKEHGHDRD
jgi:hypothetical protein